MQRKIRGILAGLKYVSVRSPSNGEGRCFSRIRFSSHCAEFKLHRFFQRKDGLELLELLTYNSFHNVQSPHAALSACAYLLTILFYVVPTPAVSCHLSLCPHGSFYRLQTTSRHWTSRYASLIFCIQARKTYQLSPCTHDLISLPLAITLNLFILV